MSGFLRIRKKQPDEQHSQRQTTIRDGFMTDPCTSYEVFS